MLNLAASFQVIDSHTAGHPTRVILSGVPPLKGDSVLEQREDFRARFDHLRTLLLHEPRGHAAMVGLLPVPSRVADYGCFFISSYVYLDMCGHGTIGFAKTLASTGALSPARGDSFTLETPVGVVTVGLVWNEDGMLKAVRLRNVPAFIGERGLKVPLEGFGEVSADIVYGGMWYALVDAAPLGLDLVPERASELQRVGSALKNAIKAKIGERVPYAGSPAPSVLFYRESAPDAATHFLVLDINKFDRSPCGTGTSARLAALIASGRIAPDATYRARNIFGVEFLARAAERTDEGAVVAEIEGIAHLSAHTTLLLERDDPLAQGFLPR
ncbi:proline racemase family protein [Ancylobacter terrae]|uniref:proline racemase family protein n=1 Tax=Ancylobacter sp. sgz301288 TaxID=3342077 RepID=UPI00385DC5D9